MSDDVDVGACAPPGLVAVRLPNRVAQQRARREAGLKAAFADVFRGVFLPVDDAFGGRLLTELLLRWIDGEAGDRWPVVWVGDEWAMLGWVPGRMVVKALETERGLIVEDLDG